MLQILRKKSQSTFIQIIVVVIALVFIFWGVGANLRGDRQAALTVNGESITFQEFQQAYDQAYQRLSDQFGGNVPKGLAETFGVKQQVINQLIQTALLRQGAREMGLQVSGEEVSRIIQEMVQFQENGVFSLERYKTVLAANRMAPTKFEDSMRLDKLAEVAAREIGNFGTFVTDIEIEQRYSEDNEQVSVKYIQVMPKNYIAKVTVEEDALKSWFETVKDNYKSEPKIKLKYLPFTYKGVGSKIEIDAAKIEEYYRNNPQQFQIPEQRHARHILLKASEADSQERRQEQLAKAEDILKKAREGADFIELAKEYSEGPSRDSGGDLGFFSAGRMVPTFDQAVFAMQAGDISEVVTTQFGYHIIKLEEIQSSRVTDLADATEEIKTILQDKEAENLAFQVANDAYEGIISAGSLAQYEADNPKAVIKETDFFSKADAPTELEEDAQFLTRAFELKNGELSSLIKGSSGYIILFAEDYQEPVVPGFEAVKERVEKDFRTEKSRELAEKAADDLLNSLREGKDLDTLVQEMGVPAIQTPLLKRTGPNDTSTFPSSLLESVFSLSESSPLPEKVGRAGDDFFVYRFVARNIPTLDKGSEDVGKYRQQIKQAKQQQIIAAWLRHQEVNAEITRHQSL